LNSLISFEIKAMKALRYKDFKEVVYNYLRSMAQSKSPDPPILSLKFKKIKSIVKRKNPTFTGTSLLSESTIEINEPPDNSLLSDYFDYQRKELYYDLIGSSMNDEPVDFRLSGNSEMLTEAPSEESETLKAAHFSLPIRDLAYTDLEIDLERISQVIQDADEEDKFRRFSCWGKINKHCVII
jgi:hypothetical protein